ncbi:MAG: DUF2182 domain-containing protein [Actinomycetota bacterium]|nr:DUF2182 domain-containing protein [Actinomycetota bacterium]
MALAAAAWLLVLVPFAGGDAAQSAHTAVHDSTPLLGAGVGWLLMATAMMLPSALPVARHLATLGLWQRRQRTIALFLGSYLVVWAGFGAVALTVFAVGGVDTALVLPAVLLLAAAWELTPWKWRYVRACRLVAPLPPRGRKADVACCATGLRYGRSCVVACWPVMLAMAAAGHENVGLMVLLTIVVTAEKLAARPSRLATPAAALLSLSAVIAMTA